MSANASRRRPAHHVVGSSDATAFASGLNVAHVRMIAYGIGGLFASIGGFAPPGSKLSADPTTVTTYTLVAAVALALGGTSFAGWRAFFWHRRMRLGAPASA
jgi:ribose transport system permease protein